MGWKREGIIRPKQVGRKPEFGKWVQASSHLYHHQQHQQPEADPIRTAVVHLLSKAYSLPCSTVAQSFSKLAQFTKRFQLALDALLRILEGGDNDNNMCVLALLLGVLSKSGGLDPTAGATNPSLSYSIHAPNPIAINPSKSVLVEAFVKKQQIAVQGSYSEVANETLVWVLWKILRGDGSDIGPLPITLARLPLPPKLRAFDLFLEVEEEKQGYNNDNNRNNDIKLTIACFKDDSTPTTFLSIASRLRIATSL
ncbi:hypothetical protein V5O48_005004 [Marasmius crinis-equi]|uniref:Uncharacterized protein n=1 Tax=Marasmius crinis-equi TaxID=585013 RepID=A0ABR3FNJ3_9AGAR